MSEYRIYFILRPPAGNKCVPKNICPLQVRRNVLKSSDVFGSRIRTLRMRVRKFCFKVQLILHSDTNDCRLRKTQQVTFHSNPWSRFGQYNHYVISTYRVFPGSPFSKITQGNTHVPTKDYSVYNHRPTASDRRHGNCSDCCPPVNGHFRLLNIDSQGIEKKLSVCIDLLHSMWICFFICVYEQISDRTFFFYYYSPHEKNHEMETQRLWGPLKWCTATNPNWKFII